MTTPYTRGIVPDVTPYQPQTPFVPRCPGCSPAEVEPHACTDHADGLGRCRCPERVCRQVQHELRKARPMLPWEEEL